MLNVDHVKNKYLLSDKYLHQPILKINQEKKGIEQALLTRTIALVAASIFQTIDFCYHIAMAFGKFPLAVLRSMGVKQLSSQEFAFKSILQHLVLSSKCLLGAATGSLFGAINPNYISFLCSNESLFRSPFAMPAPVKLEGLINTYRSHVHGRSKEFKIDHQELAANFLKGNNSDLNLHLDQLFGHVYLLNLEKNPEKRDRTLANLKKLGLDGDKVEVFKATLGVDAFKDEETRARMKDNSFGVEDTSKLSKQHAAQMGCWDSHYRIIRDAKEKYDAAVVAYETAKVRGFSDADEEKRLLEGIRQYSSILICEDDAEFGIVNDDGSSYSQDGIKSLFLNVMKELPEKWDMLNFCNYRIYPLKEQKHSYQHLIRENYALTTSTYAINASMYEVLLKGLEKINDPNADLVPVDHYLASLNDDIYCFGPRQPIALQDDSNSSDINITSRVNRYFQPKHTY